jgi:hypothetical protein
LPQTHLRLQNRPRRSSSSGSALDFSEYCPLMQLMALQRNRRAHVGRLWDLQFMEIWACRMDHTLRWHVLLVDGKAGKVNLESGRAKRSAPWGWKIQIWSATSVRSAPQQLGTKVGSSPDRPDQVSSRGKILRTGALLRTRSWARAIMKFRRGALHSEPLTNTCPSDFLCAERQGREIIVERLKDKAIPWQVQRRLMQSVTNTYRCGAYWHRMGLRDGGRTSQNIQ